VLFRSEDEIALREAFIAHFAEQPIVRNTYVCRGSDKLIDLLKAECLVGATVTCGGFYGPQGRILRAQPQIKDLVAKLQSFDSATTQIANFEMETAGIHALGRILGHHACSVSAIIANRCTQQFSAKPKETVDQLIRLVLEKVSKQLTNISDIQHKTAVTLD
jgi:uridine phosphorylase